MPYESRTYRTYGSYFRKHLHLEIADRRITRKEAAARLGVRPHVITNRLSQGWTDAEAAAIPFNVRRESDEARAAVRALVIRCTVEDD